MIGSGGGWGFGGCGGRGEKWFSPEVNWVTGRTGPSSRGGPK